MDQLQGLEDEPNREIKRNGEKWKERVLSFFFLTLKHSCRLSRSCMDCVVTQTRLRMRAQQFTSTAALVQKSPPFPLSIIYHFQPNSRKSVFSHPSAFKTFKQHSFM